MATQSVRWWDGAPLGSHYELAAGAAPLGPHYAPLAYELAAGTASESTGVTPSQQPPDVSSMTQTKTAVKTDTETTSVTKTPTKDSTKKKDQTDDDPGFFAKMFRWLFGDDKEEEEMFGEPEGRSFWEGWVAHTLYLFVAYALFYGCLKLATQAPPASVTPIRVGSLSIFLTLCILQNVFFLQG